MPTLEPFSVYIVDELDKTDRGEGGHGSSCALVVLPAAARPEA